DGIFKPDFFQNLNEIFDVYLIKNRQSSYADVIADINRIHPDLSAKMGDASAVEKYFNYKRDGSLSALGIDEAAWSALLAKYPGKRFEIEALFVNIAPSSAKKLAADLEDKAFRAYLFESGKSVRAWESVHHLKEGVRLNTTILGKIDNLRTAGKIPATKLDLALKNQLGEILDAADNTAVNQILDRLNMSHVNEAHFDKITQRLYNYPDLKQDLINNPNWFETFDDILDNPGKYWDIVGEGNILPGTPLSKWGQGYWWKNLRELADEFERLAALDKVQDIFGSIYGTNITLKVTNNVTGEIMEIVPDFLALKNGKYHIIDAKYTTKANFIIEKSFTPNQGDVFPWIKNQANISVEVRSPNSKLENIPGLNQGDFLPTAGLKIDIIKSKQNNNTIVETLINYH
ncbi:MAG: TraB/GumN family protein, partial [Saprospiraceae bacterium]|nr:TraB/GumN family protein [Saprospiraceae bacterium]